MYSALNGAAARTDEPRPLRVALFLGSDITAHSIANALLPELLDRGHSVTLYLTYGHAKKDAPKPLHELFFCEHTLLQRYGYPYLDRHAKPDPERPNSPGCWRELGRHGVRVTSVEDVNDPDFIRELERDRPDVSVSLRCYQKFGEEIIERLGHQPGSYLMNLHPGILPRYRGVMTVLRSMQEGADEAGFTLHHVEPEFDTGAVVSQAVYPLDYDLPVLDNMTRRYQRGADLVLDLVDQVAMDNSVEGVPQEPEEAQYYSYATRADLAELRARGIELYRSDSVVDSICDTFGATVPEPAGLRTELRAALHSAGIPPAR
jgi:folate-dependent phosphoribosylglycinamide formyltransferase PurN